MPVVMSDKAFDELVSDALDTIPKELTDAIDNVVILVEPNNPESPHILGLYSGVALTSRDHDYGGFLPDTITIYREALMDVCDTEEQLRHEIRVTVLHEIGHHFGIDDHRLHDLGWA